MYGWSEIQRRGRNQLKAVSLAENLKSINIKKILMRKIYNFAIAKLLKQKNRNDIK